MGVLGTNTLARGITDTGIAVGAAVALGWGAYRVRAGEMDLAALLIVLMLGVEVFRPLRELRMLLHQGMLGIAAAQGIFRILDAEPLVSDAAPAMPPRTAQRSSPTVTFEDVRFSYPGGRRPAHDGLSFRGARGRAGGHRRAERLGQVHGGAPAAALLRPRSGRASWSAAATSAICRSTSSEA